MNCTTKAGLRVWRTGLLIFVCGAALAASGADVLFYGLGKGNNYQQTSASTTVLDPVDPWEATAFVFVNGIGSVSAAYIGPTSNPTQFAMSNDGDRFDFSLSGASQAAVDSDLPNGVPFTITMQTVNDGTKAANLSISGNAYPNTPLATNYAAMQAVGPGTNFTVYWNAFTGGTMSDVIIASVVANQYAPYGSLTNSPLPGTSSALNGTNRAWTIPAGFLQPNSNYWVRIVFYKVVTTDTTDYPGVTGYGLYGVGTTVPLVTTSAGIPKPVINASPTNQTVYVGSNVLMSVTASGTGLAYQWRRTNTNLSGATSSAYSIPNAQLNSAGDYTVVVTNTGGSVTSAVANLTVVLPPVPIISQPPTNVTVSAGTTANFYVVASGFNLTYQWRRSGTNVPGAIASSYSVSNAQLVDAVSYAVVVANAGGSVTSSPPATLTVLVSSATDGSLDPTFNTGAGANSWVNIVLEQPDGKLLIGGLFTTFNGTSRPYVARLNWDGSLDGTFNPGTGPNNALVGLALQPDGKPIIGGFFTTVAGQNFRYVARLQSNGTLDPSFATGTNLNNTVRAVALQGDGKVLIGGDFTAYNTTNRNRVARLNPDGSLDTSFNPGTGADGTVNVILVQSDGKILIGGTFGNVNGTNRASVARLNSNGSLDSSFAPGTAAQFWVNAMTLQSDGKIIIGGPFTTYNGTGRKGVARLLPGGALDTTFDPLAGADNWVNSVALQPDGKVALGGIFTNFNNVVVNHITRLGTNGAPDATFSAGTGFNDAVQSLIRCADGTIVVGGLFTSYNGATANRIARIVAAPGAPYPRVQFGTAGATLTLQWPAVLGSYQLQASPGLASGFTNFTGTLSTNGGTISTSLPLNGAARFFRLKK